MARSMRPRRGQKAVTIQEDDSSSAASGSRQHLQRRAKDKVYAEKLQSGVTRRALGDVAHREGQRANNKDEQSEGEPTNKVDVSKPKTRSSKRKRTTDTTTKSDKKLKASTTTKRRTRTTTTTATQPKLKYPINTTTVSKIFYDEKLKTKRPYSGTVINYDTTDKLYKVLYEDGDEEEMDVIDLGKIVVDKKKSGKVGAPSSKKSKNDDGAPKEEPVQPPTKRQTRGMKKKAEEGIKVVTQDEDFVKDLVDDKNATTKSSKEMVDEEWDCPACTFKNKAKSMCEMCETPKPRVLLPVVKEWEEKMIASRKKDESEKEIKFNGVITSYDDIDERDYDDPNCNSRYVDDYYANYRAKEEATSTRPGYMDDGTQPSINHRMRAILVDWLIEVHLKFRLAPETLYLTVNIIDRYLNKKMVSRPRLQLVGVVAFMIATKYEEVYPPEIRDLVYICDNSYSKLELLDMEEFILKELNYNVTVPSAHAFLIRYLKAGHADEKIVRVACYILDGTLTSYKMLKYLPSQLAAAAVFIARHHTERRNWSPTLQHYTQYTEEEIKPIAREVLAAKAATPASLKSVRLKYEEERFGRIANEEILSDF